MHMGEMRFKQRPREEQAEVDDVKGEAFMEVIQMILFLIEGDIACRIFGVDSEKFVTAILKPKVKVGAEWVNKGQNLEQVDAPI